MAETHTTQKINFFVFYRAYKFKLYKKPNSNKGGTKC